MSELPSADRSLTDQDIAGLLELEARPLAADAPGHLSIVLKFNDHAALMGEPPAAIFRRHRRRGAI